MLLVAALLLRCQGGPLTRPELIRNPARDPDDSHEYYWAGKQYAVAMESLAPRLQDRGRSAQLLMQADDNSVLTEANVLAALEDFRAAAVSMFGCHPQAAALGITGDVELRTLDGPAVLLGLSGRFWHRRETVLANAAAYLRQRIPELADVDVLDPDDLVDVVTDVETGIVLEDRRSPDLNGDRETLEYQGIDPDTRGPFAQPAGGFRAGGSIFS